MKELDINLDLTNFYKCNNDDEDYYCKKYFPNYDIRYKEREAMKTKLLTDDVKVIDKCNTSNNRKGYDVFFCRLLKDMFSLKKDDYLLIFFADDKDLYDSENFGYEGCNIFNILYLKNKEQLSVFEINNNLWKQKIWLYNNLLPDSSQNQKIYYNIKQINIKIKCKVFLEYEED